MPNIKYIAVGEGEKILLLHGWGQNKEMMLPIIDELKEKYKCILVDMPGFGESNYNGEKNIEEYVSTLRKFLEINNLLPKYVVGHSFGGKIALHYCLKYNDLSKLVIIASPILKPTRTFKYYYKVAKYKIKKTMKIKNNNKEGSDDYKNCSIDMKSFFVNVVNTHYDINIRNIDIPVLLIWGKNDNKVPLKKAKKLNKTLKNSELYIEKGGHFAYLENIQFTRLVIQKFFRGGII